jgi:hypothetical protein
MLGPFGVVPGIVGGVLGLLELRRIRGGDAPSSGEGYAVFACALGTVFAVAAAFLALSAIARMS